MRSHGYDKERGYDDNRNKDKSAADACGCVLARLQSAAMSGKKQPHHLSRAREDDTGWCEALSGLPEVNDVSEDVSGQIKLAPNGDSELSAEEAAAALLDHSITALQVEARPRVLCLHAPGPPTHGR